MPLIDLPGLGHFKDRENAMIAEDFSASKAYAAGDYCYYNGTLYKFKTAHAAGAWTIADVEAAKLAHDVSDLKESLNDISIDTKVSTRWNQGYINSAGAIGSDSQSCVTDYIESNGYEYFLTVGDGYTTKVALYNSSKTFVELVSALSSGNKSFRVAKGNFVRVQVTSSASLSPSSITDNIIKIDERTYTDKTLSKENIPADAKVVGDEIAAANAALSKVDNVLYPKITEDLTEDFQTILDQHKGYYIKLDLAIGTAVSYEPLPANESTSYAIYECEEGDKFIITGRGGNASRLWGFVDIDDKLLSVSGANINTGDTPITATAPANGRIIINTTTLTNPLPTLSHTYIKDAFTEVTEDVSEAKSDIAAINAQTDSIINLLGINSKYYHGQLSSLESDLPARYTPILDVTAWPTLGENTTYADIITAFDSLVTDGAGYVTKQDMGAASGLIDGVAPHVYMYTFKPTIATTPITPQIMPVILIDASMHGFEKNSTYAWFYFLYDLVHNYAQNPTLAYIRSNVEIKIIPVLNPYGFENNDYLNGNGVNINRNFDTPDWVYVESGSNASGDAPMDQPETQIVAQFIEDNPTALMYINTHTNGKYYSNGYPEANTNLMTCITGDYYQNRLMSALKKHVQSQTVILPTEYSQLTPIFGQTIGRCDQSTLDADPTTHPGVFEKYVTLRTENMGFTFELFNGLSVDSVNVLPVFDPITKAVASEIAGNMLIEIIKEYSK